MAEFAALVKKYKDRKKDTLIDSVSTGLSYADNIAVDLGLIDIPVDHTPVLIGVIVVKGGGENRRLCGTVRRNQLLFNDQYGTCSALVCLTAELGEHPVNADILRISGNSCNSEYGVTFFYFGSIGKNADMFSRLHRVLFFPFVAVRHTAEAQHDCT